MRDKREGKEMNKHYFYVSQNFYFQFNRPKMHDVHLENYL